MEEEKKGKEAVEKLREGLGYAMPWHETVAKYDPEFFELLANRMIHTRKGPLPRKVVEFIAIALDAAVVTPYERGLARHMRNALEHGATIEEIMQVLEVSSSFSIHAISRGTEILNEVVKGLK